MRKVGIVLLIVWAVLATFLLVMACIAYNEVDLEYDELETMYEDVSGKYADLLAEKSEEGLELADAVMFEAWANCVSEKNFVCKVDDETVMIVVYAEGRTKDKFMEDMSGFGPALTAALKTGEYSKGIIVFMDDGNNVWAGTTGAADGESWPFVTDSWMN